MSLCLVAGTLLDTTGTETVLHSFTGIPDGAGPQTGLVRDAQGNLYGTTYAGGYLCESQSSGCGTVFKLDTTGTETVLHSFTPLDGMFPQAGLVRDAQGNLYGTTTGGAYGAGTVFKVDASGRETVLYSFNGPDGAFPFGGLVQDAQGNLYGITELGGASNYGTVFKLDTTGTETVLYSFTGPPDGAKPFAGLVRDAQGNLYGTTTRGGTYSFGTVFEVDTTRKKIVLYSFTGPPDGANPFAGLVRDAQGNLYGTTTRGGTYSFGTVFELQMGATLTVSTSGNGTVTSTDGFISCPGTCSHTYSSGAQVTLNAAPGQGWVFGGWNGPLPWHWFLHRYDDAILICRRHLFTSAAIRSGDSVPSD